MNFTVQTPSGNNDFTLLFIGALFFWVLVLGRVLTRRDFDSITRLTWVVVVIFVPVFGVLLYLLLAPGWEPKKIHPANQLAGTPWEKDPSHRQSR